MINTVSIDSNNKKNNSLLNGGIVVGGTLLGISGGRVALKASGFDTFVKTTINNMQEETEEIVNKEIQNIQKKHYKMARKNKKYFDFIDNVLEQRKEFGKDFQLEDFLDKEDLKKFSDEIKKLQSEANEVTKEYLSKFKKNTLHKKLKYSGIGAAIGLGVGALVVGTKTYLNSKNNKKV